MKKILWVIGGFAAFLGACALVGATRTDHPLPPSQVVTSSADVPVDPIPEITRDQESARQFPITASAEGAVRLLAIHKGDDFPLDHPNGQSALLWRDAALAEAQLAPLLAETITPDGRPHPLPFMVVQLRKIEKARYDARRMATAEAIAYAIRKERDAWSPPDDVITSRNIRIERAGACLKVDAPLLSSPEDLCGDAADLVLSAISEERG